jgi:hypothetical protein
MKKFRLGLLLDGVCVSKYVYEFIKWALVNEHLELRAIFVRSPAQASGSSLLPDHWHEEEDCESYRRPLAILLFKLILVLERLLLLKNRDHYHHLHRFDLSSILPAEMIRDPPTDDSALITAPDLDLLITFALGPIDKGIWKTARLGVIALSPSDDRLYRGGPPGFWQVYFREDVTAFTIQHLQPSSGENETLFRGQIATQFYFLLNQASLFQKSSYYLRQVVEQVAITGTLPTGQEKLPSSDIPQGMPAMRHTVRYALGLGRLLISRILQKLGADYRWKVAFLPGGWRGAVLWRASVIENERGHYLADPFVITRDGKHFCFVEDYDIANKRGKITVYELGDGHATYLGVALQEEFHLSYPYLFDYHGEIFMCPETSAAREIRVYKCVEFPLRWKLESTLMKGVSAVDSMLFERAGRWWMLTNIDPEGWGDHSLELHVYSATTPLDVHWRPHRGNPFFIDAARTRNGGMVRDGDRLFRVAQGQGFGMYGKRTTVNEIVELTDDRYVERPVCVISPKFRLKIFGTHHFHSDGTITVLDFA